MYGTEILHDLEFLSSFFKKTGAVRSAAEMVVVPRVGVDSDPSDSGGGQHI